MFSRYSVIFETFTEKHFIKDFIKKYSPKVWAIVEEVLRGRLQNSELALQKDFMETIVQKDSLLLCKILSIQVPGQHTSGRKSGYRAIVTINTVTKTVHVLLFYHKNNVRKNQAETVWWKGVVRDNYPEYRDLL